MPHLERPDGARIAWSSDGDPDAPPVLLVMGLAYPAAMWWRLVPALTERYRVLRLDNRGAGLTGDVAGAPYTVETMAADCVAVLDETGTDAAQVVGLSMGGLIAQEIALSAAERVRSLCLAATHAGAAHAVWDPEALAMLGNRGQLTVQEAAEMSLPFNYAPGTSRERIEQDWAVRFPLAASPEGYLNQLTGSSRWSGLPRLSAVSAPTLVLHGEIDRLVPADNGRMLAQAIPGAELTVLPDANHLLMTDQPEQVEKVLLGWLDRHR